MLQGSTSSMECWNIKINVDKTQAIYFSDGSGLVEVQLILNTKSILFVNNEKYLNVMFDRITCKTD
jgi:hypothetical protein